MTATKSKPTPVEIAGTWLTCGDEVVFVSPGYEMYDRRGAFGWIDTESAAYREWVGGEAAATDDVFAHHDLTAVNTGGRYWMVTRRTDTDAGGWLRENKGQWLTEAEMRQAVITLMTDGGNGRAARVTVYRAAVSGNYRVTW